jgi:hypothetical protein
MLLSFIQVSKGRLPWDRTNINKGQLGLLDSHEPNTGENGHDGE